MNLKAWDSAQKKAILHKVIIVTIGLILITIIIISVVISCKRSIQYNKFQRKVNLIFFFNIFY
jgi:hypothetical protein